MRAAFSSLLFVAVSLAVPLAAQPRFAVPDTWIPGAINEVYGWDTSAVPEFRVDMERPNGKVLVTARSFTVPDERPLGAALVAFEVTSAPGPVTVRIYDSHDVLLETHASTVAPRALAVEVLRLDKTMSTLRATPDPQKDKEAQAIWAIYLRRRVSELGGLGPVRLPVVGFTQSSGFGDSRRYEYSDGTSASDYHRGTDFATPVGTPVSAAAAGTVVLSANRKLTGETLVVEHAPAVYSVYFHLKTRNVKEGARVVAGQLLATSGATGLATGPHLHWEFRCHGIPVDPLGLVTGGLLDKDKRNALISSIEQKRG